MPRNAVSRRGLGRESAGRLRRLTCCVKALATLFCLLAVSSAAAAQTRIDVILSRSDASIELFFSMPTEVATEHFGLEQSDLTNRDGYANFDLFSEGTFHLARAFWQGAQASLDGDRVPFEAMSLMMHPKYRPLPFRTPFDATTAIEVCGVVESDVPISDTYVYVGFNASPGDTGGALRLELPDALPDGTEIRLRDFSDHQLIYSAPLEGGATRVIIVPETVVERNPLYSMSAFFVISVLLGGLAFVGLRDTDPRSA